MSRPLRILILEDNPADAELILRELRRAGFDLRVQRAVTEAEYLTALESPPDVILADYHLPQFDAHAALAGLQARGLDIPLIVVSGTLSDEVAVDCVKQGAADYLLKDRLARLGAAVTQALEARRLRARRRRAEEVARALVEVGRELAATLEPAQVNERIVGTVLRLFGVRLCLLSQLDRDSGDLLCVAVAPEAGAPGRIGSRLPAGTGVAGRAVAEGRAIVADVAADGTLQLPGSIRQQLVADRIGTLAAVPLTARGETLGALSLGDEPGRVFTEEELTLLSAFGDQVAVALQNARLFQAIQAQLRQTETLLAVSQSVSNTLDPAETMRGVARELGQTLGADSVGAYLPDARGMVLKPLAG